MAKKDYIAELEEDKRRSVFRICLSLGILLAWLAIYCLLLFVGIIDAGNIGILNGVSLVLAAVCISVTGANFNGWNKANKSLHEYNYRVQQKKKKR